MGSGSPLTAFVALLCSTLGLCHRAEAAGVVVVPLDIRGFAPQIGTAATKQLAQTIRGLKINVVDRSTIDERLGVDLAQQASACEYDTFCLVEVGDLLRADRILVGHIRGRRANGGERMELKLVVLDVVKAKLDSTLVWRLETKDEGLILSALDAAARQLLSKPNVQLSFDLAPKDARVYFNGDLFKRPSGSSSGRTSPFWSGTYEMRLERDGYQPEVRRVTLVETTEPQLIKATLELDPLYVPDPHSARRRSEPFEQSSRREGSGISALDVAKVEQVKNEPEIPWLKYVPWGLVASGVGLGSGGLVLMSGAQSGYNEVANELRYTGQTTSVDEAREVRADAVGQHRVGSVLLGSGILLLAGGVVWLSLDLLSDAR